MSRLEEALRRFNNAIPASESANGQSQVFASPWSVKTPRIEEAPTSVEEGPTSVERAPTSAALSSAASRLLEVPTHSPDENWTRWLVSQDFNPAIVEQFRKMAAALIHGQREGRLRVIMVTSAVPGEGKTLTALNLALVLAESYRRRVLLIDGDLRRPRISESANLSVSEGLGEVLKAQDERKAPLTQLADRLWLLPAGRPDPQPLSGISSQRMQHLLEEAAERFDWVIVDTPPATVTADAGLIGALVDGTVLVVRAGQTPHTAVRHSVEMLGHDRIFGVVLNGVEAKPKDGGYGYPVRDVTP
jgi:capsular exopolysaccharide synthesis family protein